MKKIWRMKHMKKIVVGKGVSFPLYVLFRLFGIPLLIYSCQSSQAIYETLRQRHHTIIISHSTIVIKNFEKWLWKSLLFGKLAGCRTIISLTKLFHGYHFEFLNHKCRTATAQKSFLENAYFLRTSFGGKFCYCTSTYQLSSKNLVGNLMCLI